MAPSRSLIRAACAAMLLAAPMGAHPGAQPSPRMVTTAAALLDYPDFFHGRSVIVRGELRHQGRTLVLLGAGARKGIYLHLTGAAPEDGSVEVRGDVFDLAKLTQDDSRLGGVDVESILQTETGGRWPGSGEVLLITVAQAAPAQPPAAPTIRSVALEPERYAEQRVTLAGRFRGANLYGDLPRAPGKSKWDFVIRSADGAVWVTGLRPRAKDLDLDPNARVDTGRSVEVDGVVRREGGLVWLEGQAIRPANAPAETAEPVTIVPPPGPPPTVVFSAPVQDDTDISPGTKVRIQFSRDMTAASFEGRVRVSYLGGAAGAAAAPPQSRVTYHDDARELEIAFEQPLERFRTVKVELLAGIVSLDHVPLAPWTLTFSVGAGGSSPSPASRPRAAALR